MVLQPRKSFCFYYFFVEEIVLDSIKYDLLSKETALKPSAWMKMEGKYQKIFAHFIAINTSFPTKWFILPHDVKAINPYLSCCWEKMREKTVINAFRPFSLPFHFPFWVPMSALPTFIFFPCSGGKFLHSVSLFLDTCKPQTFCDVHIHALLPRFIHVDLVPIFFLCSV